MASYACCASGDGPPSPGMGYEASLVWDPKNRRVIRWAGHNQGGGGEQPDFVGPETLTMRELAEQYLAERQLERRVRSAPMPRRITRALDVRNTSITGIRGERTWQQWLRSHPPPAEA